jgi:hypothetical protein
LTPDDDITSNYTSEENLSEKSDVNLEPELLNSNNRNYKAHRDTLKKSKSSTISITASASTTRLTELEIKERVAKSLKKSNNKKNSQNKRNYTKNKEKRKIKSLVKLGGKDGGIFD